MPEAQSMNLDDSISKQTTLFGLIAENASTNRLFVLVNRMIKNEGGDAMIIPMNIREDDFYFTVSNMKKSHVTGAYIAQEYQESVLDLLDEKEEEVLVYNRCDFVVVKNERLYGYLLEKNDVASLEALSGIVYDRILEV